MNEMKIIAHISNDYHEKFGIPRQSGLVEGVTSRIVFEKEYRNKEAFRGLLDYDYIWLLWQFSRNHPRKWSATVKPPRLGGKKRMGVFATRSPYRPNNIGLSSVQLLDIDYDHEDGPLLLVSGADLLDGTPIYDIKPYLSYVDSHPNARSGFGAQVAEHKITVEIPPKWEKMLTHKQLKNVVELLQQDPRPGYDNEQGRTYRMVYGNYDIHFIAWEDTFTVSKIIVL